MTCNRSHWRFDIEHERGMHDSQDRPETTYQEASAAAVAEYERRTGRKVDTAYQVRAERLERTATDEFEGVPA